MGKIEEFLNYLNALVVTSENLGVFAHFLSSFGVLITALIILTRIKRYREMIFGLWNALDWWWMIWEGGLPLLLPVIMAVFIKAMEYTGPRADGLENFTVWSETTPWTLVFFALTLNAHSMRKLWPHLEDFKSSFASILLITFLVAVYAAFLIEWRGVKGWEPPLKCYSVAIVLTGLSVLFCSSISRIPHYIAKVQTYSKAVDHGGESREGGKGSDDKKNFEA